MAFIKPHVLEAGNAEKLVEIIEHNGFYVNRRKEIALSQDAAAQLFCDRKETPGFNALIEKATSGPSLVLVLSKLDAVRSLVKLAGPSTVKNAQHQSPNSLRALFGSENPGENAIEVSSSSQAAEADIENFFPSGPVNKLPAKDYLLETVMPGLVEALTDMCIMKPKDPYDWLQNWLQANRPRQSAGQWPTSVLAGHVICADQYEGIETSGGSEPSVWNFRRAENRAGIFGIGQCTLDGLEYTAQKLREQGYNNVVWANMRDEPVLYVNGEPVAVRAEDAVDSRPAYFPKCARKLSSMESRLRRDMLSAAGLNCGDLGVFHQAGDSHELQQVKVEKANTMDEAFQRLQETVSAREEAAQNYPPPHPILDPETAVTCRYGSTEDLLPGVVQSFADGSYEVLFEDGEIQARTEADIQWPEPAPLAPALACVDYWRLPIADETRPTPADMDTLVGMLRKISFGSGSAVLFSCHTGTGRTVTGMVAASILYHIQHGWKQDSMYSIDKDSPNLAKGEFEGVVQLVQIVNDGLEMKALVDKALGECSSDLHQRMEAAANPSEELSTLQQRYSYLILFAAFLRENMSTLGTMSFEQWLTPQLGVVKVLAKM